MYFNDSYETQSCGHSGSAQLLGERSRYASSRIEPSMDFRSLP